MKPRNVLKFVALCASVALGACAKPEPSMSYFPLEAGHRWVYSTTTAWENQVIEHDTVTLSAIGQEDLEGSAAWRRRSESGVDYWLRADETGIFRVAAKSDLEDAPKLDPVKRYVLKEPLQTGTQWQAATTAYLLHRRQEFPREIRHTHPAVPMVYAIDAVDQTVDTLAGRFNQCIKVKGVALVRLYADPVVGWRDMPLQTMEWYCRGVGLVKLVREERAESTFLGGGTYTMELTDWH
jgi:hypothetical protein